MRGVGGAASSWDGVALSTVAVGNPGDNVLDNSGRRRQCLLGPLRLGDGHAIHACSGQPRVIPARAPPVWDACDAQGADGAGQGGRIEPDWNESAQTAPDDVLDQRTDW